MNEAINVAVSFETKTFGECPDKVSNHTILQTVVLHCPLISELRLSKSTGIL